MKLKMIKKLILLSIASVTFFSAQQINAQNKGDKKIIALRSFREKFVGIEMKDSKLYAKYNSASQPISQFKVYDLGNNQIALKGSNDKFVTYNEHNVVSASKIIMGDKEKFTIVKVSDEWIALKASDGTFVSLDKKNDDMLITGKTEVREWETFFITVIYNPEVKTEDISLTGTVVNDKTKKAIVANVEITNSVSGETIAKVATGADGKFSTKIPTNTKITVNARCEKYLPASQNVETTGKKSAQVDLTLVPIEVGGMVKLNNILFQTGKATLKAESYSELDNIYQVFIDNPAMEVEISGHTDSDGSDTYNQKLSADRANSVKDYLVQKGVVATRITAVGYGESKPVASNDTPEGKEKNRRVEFKILKN
jgi:outer membrane protein OmpA-like peptidoglycan-associated protein